ncbi:unnamed protein product, partial [Meganyctiphanes norvegica]
MDFTMNMIDGSSRGGIPVTQSAAVTAAMGGQVAAAATYPTTAAHTVTVASIIPPGQQHHQQQQHQQQQQQQQQQQHRVSLHDNEGGGSGIGGGGEGNTKIQQQQQSSVTEVNKDDSEGAFTPPPPRVASVGAATPHNDSRLEKGTDTNDFSEPLIKVEIRGGIPGLNSGAERDKNSVVQLHFNSVNEVLHYFSQRSVPQHIDAFNLLTNPELVRNINPDLVRNHFLYVPNPQEGVRVASNGYSSGGSNPSLTPPAQTSATSPVAIKHSVSSANNNFQLKQEVRPRESGQSASSSSTTSNVTANMITRPPRVETTNSTSFVCWICGLDLQKSLQFEEHMVDQHSVEKPYRCDDCGVTFKRKAHLDRHRRIHLPVRPYQCAVCGKGFTRNEHVRRHSFTHSGEKPYVCPTCNKTFSRREHLTKHLLSHTKLPGPHSPPGIAGHGPHTPGEYEYMCSSSPASTPPAAAPTQQEAVAAESAAAVAAAVSAISQLSGGSAIHIPHSLFTAGTVPQFLQQQQISATSQPNNTINISPIKQNQRVMQ